MNWEKIKDKAKTHLVRRQNLLFALLASVGVFLMVLSQFIDKRMLSEGIAFIMIGCVGILMSWTTTDIGASIKEAIHDASRENKMASESIAKSLSEFAKSLSEFAKSQSEFAKSQNKNHAEITSSQNKNHTEMIGVLKRIEDILQKKD